MDDQEEALLQEIVENPDDDTPRLIYASYFLEHSKDWARMEKVIRPIVEGDSTDYEAAGFFGPVHISRAERNVGNDADAHHAARRVRSEKCARADEKRAKD